MAANIKLEIKNKSENTGWFNKITANEFITIIKERKYKKNTRPLNSGKKLKYIKVSTQKLYHINIFYFEQRNLTSNIILLTIKNFLKWFPKLFLVFCKKFLINTWVLMDFRRI